jgi:hypothetical protein
MKENTAHKVILNEFEIQEQAGRMALNRFINTQPTIYSQKFFADRYSNVDLIWYSAFTKYYVELKGRKMLHTNEKGFIIKKSKYDSLQNIYENEIFSELPQPEMLYVNVCLDAVVIFNLTDFDFHPSVWKVEEHKKTECGDQTITKQVVTYLPLSAASHVFIFETRLKDCLQQLKEKYK